MIIKDFLILKLQQLMEEGYFHQKKVFIFGANDLGKITANFLIDNQIEIIGYIDNNKDLQLKKIGNLSVFPVSKLKDFSDKKSHRFLISSIYYKEMKEQLESFGYHEHENINQIINLNKSEVLENYYEFKKYLSVIEFGLRKGNEIYHRIRKEFGEVKIFLFPSIAKGDILYIRSYIQTYAQKYGFSNFVFIATSESNYSLAKGYGIKNIFLINEYEICYLVQFSKFEPDKLKILHVSYLHYEIFKNFYITRKLNFVEYYKYGVFDLQETDLVFTPIIKTNNTLLIEEVKRKFNIQERKAIIIAPYARSVKNINGYFWVNLASELKKIGFQVFTNCNGKTELPILGTRRMEFNANISRGIIDCCVAFISLRSGLCDLVSSSECEKFIIYPSYDFYGSTPIQFYTLENEISNRENLYEFEFTGGDETRIIQQIKEKILNKLEG